MQNKNAVMIYCHFKTKTKCWNCNHLLIANYAFFSSTNKHLGISCTLLSFFNQIKSNLNVFSNLIIQQWFHFKPTLWGSSNHIPFVIPLFWGCCILTSHCGGTSHKITPFSCQKLPKITKTTLKWTPLPFSPLHFLADPVLPFALISPLPLAQNWAVARPI